MRLNFVYYNLLLFLFSFFAEGPKCLYHFLQLEHLMLNIFQSWSAICWLLSWLLFFSSNIFSTHLIPKEQFSLVKDMGLIILIFQYLKILGHNFWSPWYQMRNYFPFRQFIFYKILFISTFKDFLYFFQKYNFVVLQFSLSVFSM